MGLRKGFRPVLFFLVLMAAAPPLDALAVDTDSEIRELKEKIETLEKRQSELYHSLEEKKMPGLFKEIAKKLSFGGLVEVEAHRDNNGKTGDTSDVKLATVELGLDADINEGVKAHVLFLWEEDSTEPIDMDEGTITVGLPAGFSLVAGKMYIPFGAFHSHVISDPLVLELGETNESTVMVGWSMGPVDASLGAFNGALDDAGDDEVQDWFGSITLTPVEGSSVGAYFTSDIGDSNNMTATIQAFKGSSVVTETVPGAGGFISLNAAGFSLEGEYLTAAKRFEAVDLDADGDGRGDKPRAYNIELSYDLLEGLEAAVKTEGAREFFDFPKTQYGGGVSYGLYENVTVSLEYLHGKFTSGEKRDLVTAQLAVEF